MKYSIFYKQNKDIIEYTISVITHLAELGGHKIVDPDDADVLLVSVCDVTQINYVEKIRKQHPDKIIVVGGHAAVYFKLFALFADYISIGQGFDFFKCQSIDEIAALPSVWDAKNPNDFIVPSTLIEWQNVPLANVTKGALYYWGAVGCKNKCQFCLTSWTNPHQKNKRSNIDKVLASHKTCTIVSNDSDDIPSRMTQSIMLKDFLVKPLKKYAVYRIGIEFATEEHRRKYGKPFTDDEFVSAMKRADEFGVRLKLFCISGIDTMDEWHALFNKIPTLYKKGNYEVKFTNLNYEMFTPLEKHRRDIDISKMFNTKIAHDFISQHKETCWALKALPCTSVENCLLKNILLYTTTLDGYEAYKRLKKDDANMLLNYYLNSGILDGSYRDMLHINHTLK